MKFQIKTIISIFPIIILLLSGSIIYPLYFISIYPSFGYAYFNIFSLATISTLALAFIFFYPQKLNSLIRNNSDLFLAISLFLIVSVIHFFIYDSYRLNDFGFSIIWISVPLLVYFTSKRFKKILPYYLLLLWLLDLSHTFFQNAQKVGIAGNRNWHAIFLLTFIIFSICFIDWDCIGKLFFRKRAVSALELQLSGETPLLRIRTKSIYSWIYKTITLPCFALLWIYSFYIIYLCDSRGTYLASILCIVLLVGLYVKKTLFSCRKNGVPPFKLRYKTKLLSRICKNSKRHAALLQFSKKIVIYLTLFILLFSGIFIYNHRNKSTKVTSFEQKISLHTNKAYKKLEEAFNEDVRIPLWIGTLNLILNNPTLGVGAVRFETAFAPYRPISYFLKPNTATRTNHPHNIILYILACYGLPGFVFWTILCIYPMIYCFFKFSNLDLIEKLSLFAYFCLFVHGCLDLILFVWPTIFIALLFLGILWSATWKGRYKKACRIDGSKNIEDINKVEIVNDFTGVTLTTIFITTGILLFIATGYNVYKETIGSYNIRSAYYFEQQNKDNIAAGYYNKGFKYIKPNRFVYKAALIAMNDLQNPTLALKLFSYYKFLPTQSYAHNNGFIALCLMQKGNLKAALPYLYKEVVNFPISTGAWYRLSYAQKVLGMENSSKFSYKNMLATLKYKNLPKSALKLILTNPDYDKRPRTIPKELLGN